MRDSGSIKHCMLIACLLFIFGCDRLVLPSKRYDPYLIKATDKVVDGQLNIRIINPVRSPIRIWIHSPDTAVQSVFDTTNPILLNEKVDSTLVFPTIGHGQHRIRYRFRLGNPSRAIFTTPVELPFSKGREYYILQGNNAPFSHNNDLMRYALDINLAVGDTISSSSDGYVVGVVDGYSRGGKDPKWKPYGNFITVYEPISGIYYQYVHLHHKGSFVAVGDSVVRGQPIGLSGMTGFTTGPHLHFSALVPTDDVEGLISIPVEFVEGYKGTDLHKGDTVKK